MFASTLAGLAFGSAGVHIPHAMSYSVATLQARVHGHRLRGTRADGAARHRGGDQRAGRLPLHRGGQSGAPPRRGGRARRRRRRRRARGRGRDPRAAPSSR
ncbi:MAG: hypothetical protein MZV65_18580 [Chromatiales bacterium]|nr:hypothetical protein [Chromatiales bacterium]